MNYSKYIKYSILKYLIAGIVFALILGVYIYFGRYHQRTLEVYRTMYIAKDKAIIINSEVQKMKTELNNLKGYLNITEPPKEALFNRIGSLETRGLSIIMGGIAYRKPYVSVNLDIRFQSKSLTEAMKKIKSIMSERFPLFLLESVKLKPNKAKSFLEVRVKGKLVTVAHGEV